MTANRTDPGRVGDADRAGQAPPEAAKASSPYGDHPSRFDWLQQLDVLRDEFEACPATPGGYRAAAVLRHQITQIEKHLGVHRGGQ